jgi:drug/metabolite transporter (DMT)-like permease
MALVGSLAAFGSSLTWAFASVRYSQASRKIGSARVNLARASIVAPSYLILVLAVHGRDLAHGLVPQRCAWLLVSVFCSYGLADALFFSAARRVGVPTALSLASTYPLWAVLVGVVFRAEPLGPLRIIGILLCVGGVVALIRLAPRIGTVEASNHAAGGLALAGLTSVLWAGNSIAVKFGSIGLDPIQVNALRYSFALVVLGLSVGVTRPAAAERIDWRLLIPAIVADGLLGSSLFVYGLSHSDLAIGATLTSLAPLISVPIAIAAGEERWSLPRLSAVALTVTGATVLVAAA